VASPRMLRRLLPSLAALGLLALAGGPATAGEPLRVTVGGENENRPVQVAADEIVAWSAGPEQGYFLRGKVLIEQGVFAVRADRAVIWAGATNWPKGKGSRVQIVAGGNVRIEDGNLGKSATTAVAELTTRQDVRLRRQATPSPGPPENEPFVREAMSLRPAAPTSGLQLAVASTPATPTQGPAPVAPPQPAPAAGGPPIQFPGVVPGVTNQFVGPAGPGGLAGVARNVTIQRRTDQPYQLKVFPSPTGEKVAVVTGGVIVTVRDARGGVILDLEADRAVIWSRGETDQLFEQMNRPEGSNTREVEFYLAGHVELRSAGQSAPGSVAAKAAEERILRAEQVYYDVQRNVAVAVEADIQFRRPGLADDIHLTAEELIQVSQNKFEAVRAHVFASRLPSDPGLQVVFAHATVEDTKLVRRGLFGQAITNRQTGEPETYVERLVRGENAQLQFEGVPVFYLPVVQGDANDPFGPLHSVAFKNDRIFGTQLYSTFNVWNLLNREPLPGTRWMADLDYLSRRGPAAGSEFDYAGKDLFGLSGDYAGKLKAYGIYDNGTDILGGGRGEFDQHPWWRGRFLFDHDQQLPGGFDVQTRLSIISDKNFLEQYYKSEFDTDINNETYQYVRQQQGQWAWTLLAKEHVRNWVTEDVWLPRADGYLLGQSFFDLFTYNVHGSAGYAELRPTSLPPFPWAPQQPTDRSDGTGRLDLFQELSLPFYLGPVRVVPYGVLDLTAYSNDLNGDSEGRVYGAAGVRASIPFSRLYPNVESELFNLNGLYHKVVLSGNYYLARTSDPFSEFPQIDRLNDDATDQALRDIYPRQVSLNPGNGYFLAYSPIFNPQLYAIRRLVDDRVDTLDSIDVFQIDLRQRWQTKRGYPGQEHVVDFLTLDTSVSLFPNSDRDNFGKSFAFLQYDATWNVGDRTSLVSTGWYDPYDHGARVFTIGAEMNRPDRTNFFLGFRSIYPVNSQAVIASASYVFSPKYAMTASSVYDFATKQTLTNSLIVTRVGSDLTVNMGFSYNAILNTFGVTFELLPNAAATNHRPGAGLFGGTPR
jgi:hypothetical protein